jgi:twinkle protein
MSKIVKRNQPCLDLKRCGSSDARQIYEAGDSFCFSCSKAFPAEEGSMAKQSGDEQFEETDTEKVKLNDAGEEDYSEKLAEIAEYPTRGFQDRGITKKVTEFFGVKVGYDTAGNIEAHYYPYGDEGPVEGYKVRKLPKSFSYIGKAGGLFGRSKFAGGGKRVIITEGEIDAMSIAQAYFDKHQKVYPVVSMPSAAGTAQLLANREWLRSFKEIVLCLDNDEPGKVATEKAIKILGVDKVKLVNLGDYKDANEVFLAEGGQELLVRIYDAQMHKPAGIIDRKDMRAQMHAKIDQVAIPYPDCLSEFNEKVKGRRRGEIALHISGTGSGKSTVIREIILDDVKVLKPEEKIGIISLEETPGDTARNLVCMQLEKNRNKQEITREEMDAGFDAVFGADDQDERVIVLDHQGSIKDESILDQIMYMILMGCVHIYIDHLTILVSEGAEGLTGNEAIDKIMNDMLRIVKNENVHIGLVSHLRKTKAGDKSFEDGYMATMDDIKGSGSIKQVCLDIFAYARNMNAETPEERNTIKKAVLKCRETGDTGPVAPSYYDVWTGRLGNSTTVKEPEMFEKI